MDNVDAPFDGLLQSLWRDAREKCEVLSRGEELAILIRPILPTLVSEAARRGNPLEAYKLSREALIVLLEIASRSGAGLGVWEISSLQANASSCLWQEIPG